MDWIEEHIDKLLGRNQSPTESQIQHSKDYRTSRENEIKMRRKVPFSNPEGESGNEEGFSGLVYCGDSIFDIPDKKRKPTRKERTPSSGGVYR